MTTMISEVYDALISAGADEKKAKAAAEAIAQNDFRFSAIEHRDSLEGFYLRLI